MLTTESQRTEDRHQTDRHSDNRRRDKRGRDNGRIDDRYQLIDGRHALEIGCALDLTTDALRGNTGDNGQRIYRSMSVKAGEKPLEISLDLPNTPLIELGLQTIAAEGSDSSHNLIVRGNPRYIFKSGRL